MFRGQLVRLRALSAADLDQVMKWVNDEAVTRYLSQVNRVSSRSQEAAYLQRMMAGDEHARAFSIETTAGEYLGLGSLDEIDFVHRRAELGIIIGQKNLQGKGYGTEAVRLLLGVAFGALNLHKVYLRVVGSHHQAIRVYENCGFREAVRFRRHCFIDGTWHDDVLMEAFADDDAAESGVE